MGKQYSYRVSEAAQKQIAELEATEHGRRLAAELAPFRATAHDLFAADLKQLEYASTIVYFRRQGSDWDAAVVKAATFKNTPAVETALPFAQKVIA